MRAFTLIEILIIIGMVAVLASASFLGLAGFRTSQDLKSATRTLVAVLRDVQSRSMSQEDDKFWGLRVSQPTKEAAVFQGSSCAYATETSKTKLKNSLEFRVPASGNLDICFEKISGYSSAGSDVTITIGVVGDVNERTITIYKNGRIE